MEGAISIADGECYLVNRFIEKPRADRYFNQIYEFSDWQQPIIRMFGRNVASPRLAAWYGDSGAVYTYSGLMNDPLPWFPVLSEIRHEIEIYIGHQFNSALLNLYRNGNDSMGFHADDEPELGDEPVIASISLGGPRRFVLRHRYRKAESAISIELTHGSLFIMKGETQRYWHHGIPKTKRVVQPRINLTYRQILNFQP